MDLQDELKKAKKIVYFLLSKRSYLTLELQQKLHQKGISAPTIAKVLSECQTAGYLNDQKLIARLVEKEAHKGRGRHYILAKLRAKGIPHEEIQKALQDLDLDPEAQIRALIQKHRGKEKPKLIAFLQRRGFELEDIFRVLN